MGYGGVQGCLRGLLLDRDPGVPAEGRASRWTASGWESMPLTPRAYVFIPPQTRGLEFNLQIFFFLKNFNVLGCLGPENYFILASECFLKARLGLYLKDSVAPSC